MKAGFPFIPILALLLLTAPLPAAQYSKLWGKNGEKWEPETSRLRDFTNVGYKKGEVPIPDWPVGVKVTDYGAVPDDMKDDSQAFLDAIAACPEKHAVLVPKGRYHILQQIRLSRDHFVLRGEDMYETVLFFPKNLIEIYPGVDYDKSYQTAFIHAEKGTGCSIENLSFEFREQMKRGHWEFRGADAIFYGKKVQDSWIRNLYIKNVDHGIDVHGQRISVLNIIFDHFIGRPDTIGTSGITRWVGHVGIGFTSRHSLYHNIEFKGRYFHDFDIINVPSHNVVSSVKGTNMALHHHGQGANHNLYTDVDMGLGTRSLGALTDDRRQKAETHWGLYGDTLFDPEKFLSARNSDHVFVGIHADIETQITDTFWYEDIAPEKLHPGNIYLAQMEKAGKPLPERPPPRPPVAANKDVVRLNPVDGELPYLKFDLRDLPLQSVERARLRVNVIRAVNPPFSYSAMPVEDDSWGGEASESQSEPAVGPELDSVEIREDVSNKWLEFEVTSFVAAQMAADQMVSFKIDKSETGTYNGYLAGPDRGNAPLLIIERTQSPVPGPPSAPTGLTTTGKKGHIVLDWNDNPESDVLYYNVYRNPTHKGKKAYSYPIAEGLVYSEFTDVTYTENRSNCDLPAGVPFRYFVSAVDKHFNESEKSTEVEGAVLGKEKELPSYR